MSSRRASCAGDSTLQRNQYWNSCVREFCARAHARINMLVSATDRPNNVNMSHALRAVVWQ